MTNYEAAVRLVEMCCDNVKYYGDQPKHCEAVALACAALIGESGAVALARAALIGESREVPENE